MQKYTIIMSSPNIRIKNREYVIIIAISIQNREGGKPNDSPPFQSFYQLIAIAFDYCQRLLT